MKHLKLLALALLSLLASGCVDRERSAAIDATASDTAVQPPDSTAANQPLRELLENPTNPEAFPLAPGSYVRGTLTAPEAGSITAAAFQIGTYANTSDGLAEVELCEQERCVKGQAELKGSEDNAYLTVRFQEPLAATANVQLGYRFSKLAGTAPVALWLYSPTQAIPPVKVNDADTLQRVPRIALQYGP